MSVPLVDVVSVECAPLPVFVSERLGHASTAITMDLYSAVTPNLQAQAVENFDKMLAER